MLFLDSIIQLIIPILKCNLLLTEQKEAEKVTSNGTVAEQTNQMPGEVSKLRDNRVKKKKKKQEKEVIGQIVSKARKSSDEDSDSEEAEFWEPPIGDRWDFDDGRGRWGSSSDTGPDTDEGKFIYLFSLLFIFPRPYSWVMRFSTITQMFSTEVNSASVWFFSQ